MTGSLATAAEVFLHCSLGVSIRVRFEGVWVYDAFVEDESVAFGACDDSKMLAGGISPEKVGVDDIDFTSFVERLCDLIDQILTHDVIVKLLRSTNIQVSPLTLQHTLP